MNHVLNDNNVSCFIQKHSAQHFYQLDSWCFARTYFSRGSTSCVPLSRNCISCAPKWPHQMYQLRPGFSAPSIRVASRGY